MNCTKSKCSVILVNWNSAKDTIACIESLKINEIRLEDVIVVDNGSDDNSTQEIREAFNNIKIIQSEKNGGFGYGCNLGIKYSLEKDYSYVWLLNNDTILKDRDSRDKLIDAMDKNKNCGIAGSLLLYENDRESVQALGGGRVNLNWGISRHIYSSDQVERVNYITAASAIVRLKAIEQVGMFDEEIFLYWEDVEMCLRFIHYGWELCIVPESVIFHKESATTNRLGPVRQRYFTQGLDVVLKKHGHKGKGYRYTLHMMRALRKLINFQAEEAREIIRYIMEMKI